MIRSSSDPFRATLAAVSLLLGTGVVLVLSLWLLGSWLEAMEESGPLTLDRWGLESLRAALGPRWEGSMVQITALGSKTNLTLITVIAVLAACLGGQRLIALKIAVAAAGAGLLTLLIKNLVERPRPGVVPWLDEWVGESFSFPSGHAFSSMAIYASLGILFARLAPTIWAARFTIAAGVAVALLVGISRIYLGVHYPTDVLAGWLAGAAWALACTYALRLLRAG